MNASPSRQRRKIGIAKQTYRPTTPIDTTAKNATGTGCSVDVARSTSAGSVMIAATTADRMTPLAGTLFLLSFDHRVAPGRRRRG